MNIQGNEMMGTLEGEERPGKPSPRPKIDPALPEQE